MRKPELSLAPDFTLVDTHGEGVSLSDFKGRKNVVLVFNRGFTWPFCQMHMAQLRRDYEQFLAREAEVIVIGPDGLKAFQTYWQKNEMPFVGLADPTHEVAGRYGQEVSLLKLGRMPALMIVDKAGQVRYQHYGNGMQDIAPNKLVLRLLDDIRREDAGQAGEPEDLSLRVPA